MSRENHPISKALKIALISSFGGRWDHRLLAGGLYYADAHGGLIISIFPFNKKTTPVITELEQWGAQGIFGILKKNDLQTLEGSLSHKIPIVNCGSTARSQSATTPAGDFSVYLENAIARLRDSRLRSCGMFLHAENGTAEECTSGISSEPTKAQASTFVLPVPDALITDPHADVRPVPETLAAWLRELPKPVGIICPLLGSSVYLARCCAALGLEVPKDVAIVASDEADTYLACEPAFASILPSVETMGTEAVRQLVRGLRETERPRQTTYPRQVKTNTRNSHNSRRPVFDIAAARSSDC
jgi:DNA-binding LacI/PurR family transcriptional regulator